jgi:hypothetical protein
MVAKQTEIGTPVNGWKYVVEEQQSEYGTEFIARKIGVFENQRKCPLFLGVFSTFEKAKEAAERRRRRSEAACRVHYRF